MGSGEVSDKVRARLAKLKALAERGMGGEKENARRMLANTLARYHLTEEDLGDDDTIAAVLSWQAKPFEKHLFFQVLVAVMGRGARYYKTEKRCTIRVDMTPAQLVEFQMLYETYREPLQTALDDVFSAFVNRHDIFPPPDENHEPRPSKPVDIDRLLRIHKLAMGLSDVEVKRRLANAQQQLEHQDGSEETS